MHILICVYNEEQNILKKIDNLRILNYPKDKLKITIISDGSTDNTNKIVKNHIDQNKIEFIHHYNQKGKSARQNEVIETIQEEIIVYTDADTIMDKYCLKVINSSFQDNEVGCVAAKVVFNEKSNLELTDSKKYYWNSEIQIRKNESKLNMLSTASGSCMAVRRSLIEPISEDVGEDTVVPLIVLNKNKRVIFSKLL